MMIIQRKIVICGAIHLSCPDLCAGMPSSPIPVSSVHWERVKGREILTFRERSVGIGYKEDKSYQNCADMKKSLR